jgi:hypothetical protein
MKSRLKRADRGFALVTALMMMVLLAVLAVGMLTLSSVELRNSGSGSAMARAKANARIGMMIALGEIQKHLGPDQRVSADARVASGGAGEPAHPHWLSVWRTTREDGTPWITRDGEKGGLSDLRQTLGWNARDERVACLVSGNEAEIGEHPVGESMIELVGPGALGGEADPSGMVLAPRVDLAEGAYAWWVGDLGAKANLATRDTTKSRPHPELLAAMLAQDASWKAFGQDDIPPEVRSRLASDAQLGLLADLSKKRDFHDLTVWSAGLPVDVREGGWRRDLTAYLESNGVIPDLKEGEVFLPGIRDSDNLVGPPNADVDAVSDKPGHAKRFSEVSPKFGLLRSWAGKSRDTPLGDLMARTELAAMAPKPSGGGNTRSVDFRNRTTTHLMPVITEGSMYYNLSYYDSPKPVQGNRYGMRVHFYPRVVLWNPYNFTLEVPQSAIFLFINGAKSVEAVMTDGRKQRYRMYWGLGGGVTGGSEQGSMFFRMDAATLKPGESLVWSPARNAPYDENNMANNQLSPTVAPSPTRSLYQDRRIDGFPLFRVQQTFPLTPGLANDLLPQIPVEWREVVPLKPGGNIQDSGYTQADDYFMSWKPFPGATLNKTAFRNAPMGRFISCAYQYGDEDELPVEWTALDSVPFARSTPTNPVVTQQPDRRTRDGFRLRWFQETESNMIGSGSLSGLPHLEDAAIGNWNLRASWAFRNPFDNVTDVAPHFFGIYTRDLFDGEVDWNSMNPVASGGSFKGDPFDQPVRSQVPRILFDIPRKGTGVVSLGAFQHVNFSEFIWHPTYALGNSLADPRVPLLHTEPDRSKSINRDKGGWNQDSIGYATDGRSDNDNGATNDEDNWAWHARDYLQQAALDQTLIYDLSYELNHSLWDAYFLSSGTIADKRGLLDDPAGSPLPNGRIKPNPMAGDTTASELTDYHRAASRMLVDGAFNVNSTSVAAWEALLLSSVGGRHGADRVAFPRILQTQGRDWQGGDPRSADAWSGQRVFSREEIRKLAERIVIEVRSRGPFLGLADFVNRRLSDDETGRKGALQAAIDSAGLNEVFVNEWPLDNSVMLPDYKHMDHIADPTRFEQTLKPDTTAWGALGFLTQADLLQFIGPALSARSDTFRIRAYGESRNAAGRVEARAWCEAVVQRSPKYVDPSDDLMEKPSTLGPVNARFGRRFEIVAFRWLDPGEV